MKKKKRVWKFFQYRECDAFATYLEKMAEDGWHLDHVGIGMTFRRGKPKKVRYEIEVLTKATEWDMNLEPNTEDFAEFCAAAGWEYVCSYRKFCIFKTEDTTVVPLETDPEQRFENTAKSTRHLKIVNLILYGLCAAMLLCSDHFAYGLLYTPLTLGALLIILAFPCTIFEATEEFIWEYTSRKALRTGGVVSYPQAKPLLKIIQTFRTIIPYIAILLLCLLKIQEPNYNKTGIPFLAMCIVPVLIDFAAMELRLSRERTFIFRIVSIVTLMTLIAIVSIWQIDSSDDTFEEPDFKEAKSFLASMNYYHTEYASCEIIESKYDWVLNQFWKTNSRKKFPGPLAPNVEAEVSQQEMERWDALSVATVEFFQKEYLILYPDRFIVFRYDGKITPEVIEKVKNLKIQN